MPADHHSCRGAKSYQFLLHANKERMVEASRYFCNSSQAMPAPVPTSLSRAVRQPVPVNYRQHPYALSPRPIGVLRMITLLFTMQATSLEAAGQQGSVPLAEAVEAYARSQRGKVEPSERSVSFAGRIGDAQAAMQSAVCTRTEPSSAIRTWWLACRCMRQLFPGYDDIACHSWGGKTR